MAQYKGSSVRDDKITVFLQLPCGMCAMHVITSHHTWETAVRLHQEMQRLQRKLIWQHLVLLDASETHLLQCRECAGVAPGCGQPQRISIRSAHAYNEQCT